MSALAKAVLAASVLMASLVAASSASALSLEKVGEFQNPIYVTSDPDDGDQLFVLERQGVIKVVEGETVETFVDFSERVSCCEGERGAASIAFSPNFSENKKLYVAYSAADSALNEEGDVVVDELVEPEDPEGELAEFAPRRVLKIPHSEAFLGHEKASLHNGGQLQFGPDGYLYLSVGDGVDFETSQNPESPLGKLLRFGPDADPPLSYTVPGDNPFAGEPGLASLVWSLGLRNPFRFSFDRFRGDLFIADVGENTREEVNWAPSPAFGKVGGAGANYGWSCREGSLTGPGVGLSLPSCVGEDVADFVEPISELGHVVPGEGGAICSGSIIGGYVVRDLDLDLGELHGRYIYSDFCTGEFRSFRVPTALGMPAKDDCRLDLQLPSGLPSSFGEDAAGRIYVASLAGGVYRIDGPPFEGCPSEPSVEESPAPSSPTTSPPPVVVSPPLEARIRARRLRARPGMVRIFISPSRCRGHSRSIVRLRRGGKANGSKRVGADCVVRFRRWVRGRSTFRAWLTPSGGESLVLSRRLRIVGHRRSARHNGHRRSSKRSVNGTPGVRPSSRSSWLKWR